MGSRRNRGRLRGHRARRDGLHHDRRLDGQGHRAARRRCCRTGRDGRRRRPGPAGTTGAGVSAARGGGSWDGTRRGGARRGSLEDAIVGGGPLRVGASELAGGREERELLVRLAEPAREHAHGARDLVGDPCTRKSRSSKSSLAMTRSLQRSWANASAERADSSRSAISPNTSPGPSTARASSPMPETLREMHTLPLGDDVHAVAAITVVEDARPLLGRSPRRSSGTGPRP